MRERCVVLEVLGLGELGQEQQQVGGGEPVGWDDAEDAEGEEGAKGGELSVGGEVRRRRRGRW
ncbi:hypothetical protein AOB60_02345 [Streptomyces noursei]|uniref:Uncharacterized protein n=1 Tax=Streptomyces noursei TaxID=1971 RepID=A0A2N8PFY5_STRNR|nr:hypothetical protein AOB60_02345 [Streptomyces noursei]